MKFKGLIFDEIKKIGSSQYWISCDKKYFLKRCKNKEKLMHEYLKLKNHWKFPEIQNFRAIKPILYDERMGFLMTEYVDAEPMINQTNRTVYQIFGLKMREFHDIGYVHGHIQFNDVLYKGGEFILTDFEEFGSWGKRWDLALLKFSIRVFQLKRPWLWWKYKDCWDMFCYGYGIDDVKFHHQYQELTMELIARGNKKAIILDKLGLLNG